MIEFFFSPVWSESVSPARVRVLKFLFTIVLISESCCSIMDRLTLGEEVEIEVVEEGEEKVESDLSLGLVGRFLTDMSIRVQTMKDRMAGVWRPRKGSSDQGSGTETVYLSVLPPT